MTDERADEREDVGKREAKFFAETQDDIPHEEEQQRDQDHLDTEAQEDVQLLQFV
jgi:hypothetical protein